MKLDLETEIRTNSRLFGLMKFNMWPVKVGYSGDKCINIQSSLPFSIECSCLKMLRLVLLMNYRGTAI